MTVGILQVEVEVPEAQSLKDKRRCVRSLKDRLAHRFNMSVAEVASLDNHRHAVFGLAMVSNDRTYIEGAFSRVVDVFAAETRVVLLDWQAEYV